MTSYRINHDNVVADTIDGEVLAIRSDTGTYYSMRDTAAEIWAAVTSGGPLDAVTATVAGFHPSADASVVAADVQAFVDTLVENTLVVVATDPATSAESVTSTSASDSPWTTPQLDRYDDMQDLLLFDPIHEVQPSGWPQVTER